MIHCRTGRDRVAPARRTHRFGAVLILVAAVAACSSGPGNSGSPAGTTAASQANASDPALSPGAASAMAAAPTPDVTALPTGVIAEILLDSGVAPFGIVTDGKAIWAAAHRASSAYRIDPHSNEVALTIDVGQEASCGMPGVGFGSIWLPPCDDSARTVVINAASGSVAGMVDNMSMVAFASNAVWGTADVNGVRSVVTFDPDSHALVGPTGAAGDYDSYAVTGSTVWGISSAGTRIDRIDPKTHDIQASFRIPGFGSDDSLYATVLDKVIWIKGYESGVLVEFDPATQQFTQHEIPGYGRPSGYYDQAPVAALGSLWLRISDTSVVRVDPADGTVVATYPAGPGGGAVAVDFGSLWVANFDTDTIWRERIDH